MTLFDEPAGRPAAEAERVDAPAAAVVKLVVAYDGTEFHGFAPQPGVRTVSATLGAALARVLRFEPALTCAGRTDAGVHAMSQVVSFPLVPAAEPRFDPERLVRAVNGMLAPEVVVRSAALAPPGFDARHRARWRSYRYNVVNRPVPDPFSARHAWWVADPLDLAAMRLAADPFLGRHDFAAFCRAGPEGTTRVREVTRSCWTDLGDGRLVYEIRAGAFCWQMVRSIVGTLVDVGRGRRRAGGVTAMLRSTDRAAAGPVAPPHGLCLWEVGY